jgi:hypothetical protein
MLIWSSNIVIGLASTWPGTTAEAFGTTIIELPIARGVGLVSKANFVSKSALIKVY